MINMFDIYYADLSKNTTKSEQGGIRPVIIIQNDTGNKYSPTILVIPLTSEIKKLSQPTHCVVHCTEKNGLNTNSMVLAEQLRVIDKSRLQSKIGFLDDLKEQDEVINTYIANITGRKSYDSSWAKLIKNFCELVRKGKCKNAA